MDWHIKLINIKGGRFGQVYNIYLDRESMKKYFAGIDAGTTGASVIIFDEKGSIVSSGYCEYTTKHPLPGWVDQDMNELWEGVCKASREATRKFKGNLEDIKSIGISSQRGSFVPIDKNWEPLIDAIVWSDGRAIKETQWIVENLGKEKYYNTTGLIPSSLWVLPKIKWLMDNKPEIYEKTWKFVNGQEWILNKLGSNEVFSVPSALNYNGMFNIETLDWSDTLLDAIKLDKDKLPPILHDLRVVGKVSKEAAELTGFLEGTPICPGGGDQQCAAVGSGVNREGMAELSMGTAAVMVAQVDDISKVNYDMDIGVSFGSHAIPGKWDMEGTAHSAGVALRWWRDTYGQIEKELGRIIEIDPYDLITLEASKAPIGCRGLIFFPYFNGQATPYYHDTARGGLIGLTQIHDRKHSARAVLEGIIYELRMTVEAMEKALGKPFETIRLSGGGARSDFWVQMQADIYGRPVERLKVSECAALGAAILGGVAAGELESIDAAIENMVHTHGIIEPNMKNHEIYTEMYYMFKKTFLALRDAGVYDELAEVAIKYGG